MQITYFRNVLLTDVTLLLSVNINNAPVFVAYPGFSQVSKSIILGLMHEDVGYYRPKYNHLLLESRLTSPENFTNIRW